MSPEEIHRIELKKLRAIVAKRDFSRAGHEEYMRQLAVVGRAFARTFVVTSNKTTKPEHQRKGKS